MLCARQHCLVAPPDPQSSYATATAARHRPMQPVLRFRAGPVRHVAAVHALSRGRLEAVLRMLRCGCCAEPASSLAAEEIGPGPFSDTPP